MGCAGWMLNSQLLVALQNNDCTKTSDLLKRGVDCDTRFHIGSQNRPAVCISVERGHIDIVRLLLEWGCSVNQTDGKGLTPLHIAANYGNSRMVALLLEHRANVAAVSEHGYTPLHLATHKNSPEICRLLVEAGAQIERVDSEGKTPLMHACIQGSTTVVSYLVEDCGVDVNFSDHLGNTALLFTAAAPFVNCEIIQILLDSGAVVDRENALGETPLHACIRGRRNDKASMLKLLLQPQVKNLKIDLNVRTQLGHTALHLAVLEREIEVVRLLLIAGIDSGLRDRLGLTALSHAAREGNLAACKLIYSAWGRVDDLGVEGMCEEVKGWLLEVAKNPKSLGAVCRGALKEWYEDDYGVFLEVVGVKLPVRLADYLAFKAL